MTTHHRRLATSTHTLVRGVERIGVWTTESVSTAELPMRAGWFDSTARRKATRKVAGSMLARPNSRRTQDGEYRMMDREEQYAESLKDLLDMELHEEERRAWNMLCFDMRKRSGESRSGGRRWHTMACESAGRLQRVRFEMEDRGIMPRVFGYEQNLIAEEETNSVLLAA